MPPLRLISRLIVEGERSAQRTPTNMENLYVRSSRTNELIPLSNLVRIEEFADSIRLNRYNRVRAITLQSGSPIPCLSANAGVQTSPAYQDSPSSG